METVSIGEIHQNTGTAQLHKWVLKHRPYKYNKTYQQKYNACTMQKKSYEQ